MFYDVWYEFCELVNGDPFILRAQTRIVYGLPRVVSIALRRGNACMTARVLKPVRP